MNWYLIIAGLLFVLMMYAVNRTDHLDVETGRRDSLDYGSNRGWYWPWTTIIQISFIVILMCLFGAVQ